ncbi:MAG: TerB family tellurite resistance protein [Polyangiaceae bacterium]|nr:TerB family tellurite resistance protein [Polyangiaceae bacterium]
MDPLGWLGLRKRRDETPRLTAVINAVRALLPEDESVVVRYIVIVGILLTQVASSDGRVAASETAHLEALFRHIDRLPPDGISNVLEVLNENVPKLSEDEVKLCFSELKSLCDGRERRQILRLLAQLATADGTIRPAEHGVLSQIAEELDVGAEELEGLEREVGAEGARASRPAQAPSAPS